MPRPEVVIQNRSRAVSFLGGNIQFRAPLNFAQIDIDLLSDPAVGSVNDARPAGGCPPPLDKVRDTPDSFSVQVNTNFFNASFGGNGWVQFVFQTPAWDDSDKDGLCVWKVDVKAQGYDRACVVFHRDRTFLGSAAERRRTSVQVLGLVQRADDGTRMLTAMAGVPWNDPGPLGAVWAVTTTDTVNGIYRGMKADTEYPLGLSQDGNWWQASGGIYGTGCGSMAQFKGTTFFETLTVATCNPFDPSCLSAPMTPFSLPYYAVGLLSFPNTTGETNNLKSRFTGALNFSCSHSTQCRSWRGSRSP